MSNKFNFPAKLLPLLSENCNSVICPYGIETVLSMVAEGASQESLEDILYALGFENLDELREAVLNVQDVRCKAFSSDNSLKLEKGVEKLEFLDKFKQIMEERYNATIEEDASDGRGKLALCNLANFKAEWLYEMERDTSHERRFLNSDRSYSLPAFLSSTQDYLYYYEGGKENGEYAYVNAVALPYKLNNERIPYELVLVDCNKDLTAEVLENVFSGMKLEECEVTFPEFSIKNEHNLIPIMQHLGAYTLFSENFPAFDKITTKPLYASKFVQKAEIEVDKNGTVAKAETYMDDCFIGDHFNYARQVVFDRPFYYFLRNTTTGEIIFMGKVNKLGDCEKRKPVAVQTMFGPVYI